LSEASQGFKDIGDRGFWGLSSEGGMGDRGRRTEINYEFIGLSLTPLERLAVIVVN